MVWDHKNVLDAFTFQHSRSDIRSYMYVRPCFLNSQNKPIETRTFCMVSLDSELLLLFLVLMSTSGPPSGPPFGARNGLNCLNCPKQKLENSLLQHESKIENSFQLGLGLARGWGVGVVLEWCFGGVWVVFG